MVDDAIEQAIKAKRSFVVEAGAGAGKTFSLVKALSYIRKHERRNLVQNRQNVACITYTNVAKNEILERTEHDDLFFVGTIHEFLWESIKPYRHELAAALVSHNESLPAKSARKADCQDLSAALESGIQIIYSDRGSNFIEGRIHHDDLISIARHFFYQNPMAARIVGFKYPIIFVDEYQDTFPEVLDILLDCVNDAAPESLVGLFGDKKQAIYPKGVGAVPDKYIKKLITLTKEENFRCSVSVIELLNKLRTDIRQFPAGDNCEGSIVYVGFDGGTQPSIQDGFDLAKSNLKSPPEFSETKVLYLTHRLIARDAEYRELFEAFRAKGGYVFDQFKAGEDPIIAFLSGPVIDLLYSWKLKRQGRSLSILEKNGFRLDSIGGRSRVKKCLDDLEALWNSNADVKSVLALILESAIMRVPDVVLYAFDLVERDESSLDDREKINQRFYKALFDVSFEEIENYWRVLRDNTPYVTKHGVKGDEFDTVIVVLDDSGAGWNQYSFGKLIAGTETNDQRLERTSNLFYVCCSRARRNLVIVDFDYDAVKASSVESLFGAQNVLIA